jgi:hypothetical protein
MKKLLLSMMMLGATVMLKAQNPYPIIALDSVQFVNDTKLNLPIVNDTMDYISPVFKNPIYRDTIRFEGIVATNPKIYGLSANRKAAYIQRKGGGPWSGVLVMCEPAGTGTTLPNLITETKFYDNFVVGFKVRVTGLAKSFNGTNPPLKQGETQINLIRNNVNWDNFVEQVDLVKDTLVYSEIEAKDIQTGNPNTNWQQQRLTGEKWEGVLVKIKNVSVYSVTTSGNRSFWSVIDDFGNVLDVRDFSAYYRRDDNEDTVPKIANTFQPPPIGTRLEYIQGIITEYQVGAISRYGITPIYPSDFKICTACPPIVKFVNRNPILSKITDTLNITFEITVGDTTLKTQYLYYKSPATPNQLDSVLMTAVPSFPNYFAGKVNPVGAEGVFTFWVRAEDKRDRQTFFPDPLTLGRQFYVTTSGVNSIQQLQYSNTTSGSSIWAGDSLLNIDVRGIVTGKNFGNMLTVQNGIGPNSAIFIQKGSNGTVDAWQVGDSVQITRATVGENFNTTNLFNILGSVVSSGNVLPSVQSSLSIDSFALNNIAYSRKYEGVLVRFDSVKVSSTNPDGPTSDFGEFSVLAKNSAATTGLRIDDLNLSFKGLNKKVKAEMMMGFIQGPMYFANGNFKLIPRNLDDVDLSKLDSVAPVITLKGMNPDTVNVGSGVYADSGATAMDNIDGDITANIVVSGSVNTAAIGTYVLTYKVTDAWGLSDSVERIVVVKDTTSVGINENELNFAQLAIYPNPATSNITVTGNFIKTQPVTILVVDVLGKVVATRTVRGTQFTEMISTENLNNGVYFCTISNASGSKTLKFMVSGK